MNAFSFWVAIEKTIYLKLAEAFQLLIIFIDIKLQLKLIFLLHTT